MGGALLAGLVALTAGACSGGGSGDGQAGVPLVRASSFLATRNTALGPVLVDPDGRTLYVNVTERDGISTCDASCSANWPPVSADVGLAPQSNPADFGAASRADGSRQLTVGGLPAYRSAKDKAPGDLLGQGLAGVWFAVAPDGRPIQRAVDEIAGSTTTTSSAPATTTPTAQISGRPVLATVDGFTLYIFSRDVAGQPSTCTDPCATTWTIVPPETTLASGPTGAAGQSQAIDRARFSTILRTDGSPQLALDGHPLYRFRGDRPGTADGHRFAGTWFAVGADGSILG